MRLFGSIACIAVGVLTLAGGRDAWNRARLPTRIVDDVLTHVQVDCQPDVCAYLFNLDGRTLATYTPAHGSAEDTLTITSSLQDAIISNDRAAEERMFWLERSAPALIAGTGVIYKGAKTVFAWDKSMARLGGEVKNSSLKNFAMALLAIGSGYAIGFFAVDNVDGLAAGSPEEMAFVSRKENWEQVRTRFYRSRLQLLATEQNAWLSQILSNHRLLQNNGRDCSNEETAGDMLDRDVAEMIRQTPAEQLNMMETISEPISIFSDYDSLIGISTYSPLLGVVIDQPLLKQCPDVITMKAFVELTKDSDAAIVTDDNHLRALNTFEAHLIEQMNRTRKASDPLEEPMITPAQIPQNEKVAVAWVVLLAAAGLILTPLAQLFSWAWKQIRN